MILKKITLLHVHAMVGKLLGPSPRWCSWDRARQYPLSQMNITMPGNNGYFRRNFFVSSQRERFLNDRW